MSSMLGLVEELEGWARREVERLRYEAARVAVALKEVEGELARLVSVREALQQRTLRPEHGDRWDTAVPRAAGAAGGGIRVTVPDREPGMDLTALPGTYRKLAQILQGSQVPLQASELTRLLGIELTASAVEGVRAKAKRLVVHGWAVQADRGRFASPSA
ncbi:hypothetical protein [Streptomyces sp. NPDC002671]